MPLSSWYMTRSKRINKIILYRLYKLSHFKTVRSNTVQQKNQATALYKPKPTRWNKNCAAARACG